MQPKSGQNRGSPSTRSLFSMLMRCERFPFACGVGAHTATIRRASRATRAPRNTRRALRQPAARHGARSMRAARGKRAVNLAKASAVCCLIRAARASQGCASDGPQGPGSARRAELSQSIVHRAQHKCRVPASAPREARAGARCRSHGTRSAGARESQDAPMSRRRSRAAALGADGGAPRGVADRARSGQCASIWRPAAGGGEVGPCLPLLVRTG